MKKADYQKQAQDLGIDFTPETTVKELQSLIEEATAGEPIAEPLQKSKEKQKPQGETDEKKKTIYYTKEPSPVRPEYFNNRKFMIISNTVMKDLKTGEKYTIVTQ